MFVQRTCVSGLFLICFDYALYGLCNGRCNCERVQKYIGYYFLLCNLSKSRKRIFRDTRSTLAKTSSRYLTRTDFRNHVTRQYHSKVLNINRYCNKTADPFIFCPTNFQVHLLKYLKTLYTLTDRTLYFSNLLFENQY